MAMTDEQVILFIRQVVSPTAEKLRDLQALCDDLVMTYGQAGGIGSKIAAMTPDELFGGIQDELGELDKEHMTAFASAVADLDTWFDAGTRLADINRLCVRALQIA